MLENYTRDALCMSIRTTPRLEPATQNSCPALYNKTTPNTPRSRVVAERPHDIYSSARHILFMRSKREPYPLTSVSLGHVKSNQPSNGLVERDFFRGSTPDRSP